MDQSQVIWEKLSQIAVTGACHDSSERRPHPSCFKNTRVTLLDGIYGLLGHQKNQLIWLNGTAGVGKSAVAFTVAEKMRGLKAKAQMNGSENRLAGTFFFSRKYTKRCTTAYFFATLAYQLATNFPSIKDDLTRAIRENPALLNLGMSLRDQMEALLLQPLRRLQIRLRECPPLVFVIDALDECASEEEIAELISLLGKALRDPNLPVTKILLTSRSEAHIREAIREEEMRPLVCEMPTETSGVTSVTSLDGADVDQDIYIFLKYSFTKLQRRCPNFPYPTEDQFALLASRAGRRFIVASTMINFIDDKDHDPRNRLQLILELTCEMLPGMEVYKMYDLILSTCANPKRAYLHLSIVAALANPLPISQISELLGPGEGKDVEAALIQLRSVMDIPTDDSLPVSIYHSSVRDYALSPSNCGLLKEPIQSPHSLLAYSSLDLMIRHLQKSTGLLDALLQLRKQSQVMKSHPPKSLRQSLAFIVEPPTTLQVVIALLWLRGDRSPQLYFWLEAPDGRAWLRTQEAKDWLQTTSGKEWLQTPSGQEWLQTPSGQEWLSPSRQDWLQTPSKREWLQTQKGQEWLQTTSAQEWLQTLSAREWLWTPSGREWLWTPSGQEWLRTPSGQEWLRTPSGREWLRTPRVREWLETPSGQEWLDTPSALEWMWAPNGREWLRTPSGRKWLQGTQIRREWLQTQSGKEWLEASSMQEWLQAPGTREWLQTPIGREWLQESTTQEWLQTPSMQEWLQTPSGLEWLRISAAEEWLRMPSTQEWLQTPSRQDWLQSPSAQVWLQTPSTQEWLQTPSGQKWLQTPSTQEWLQTPSVQEWLQTPSRQEWLQTPRGQEWLQTPSGQEWLQTPSGQEWLQTTSGREWLQTPSGREWLQTQSGEVWLQTPPGQAWQSTPAASVWVHMEEFLHTVEAISKFMIIPESSDLSLHPAFQVIQQFKSLPDFLILPVLLSSKIPQNPTSALVQGSESLDMEIIHAIKAFVSLTNEARERSQSTPNTVMYACQNWVMHLSQALNPWNNELKHVFEVFWNNHLLSWLERQWFLRGLQSCLIVLSEAQKFAKEHLPVHVQVPPAKSSVISRFLTILTSLILCKT